MTEKDCMLLNQINTITNKLAVFSLAFQLSHEIGREPHPDDSAYGEMLDKTLKSLDYMKKCIESKEYNKTLYIDVIKRVYLFVEADESGKFEGRESDGSPFDLMDLVPDFEDIHEELVEGMRKLSIIFDEKATDILRPLLDYIEKANLPVKELPWKYQALVNAIIGTVHEGYKLEYLIMRLDEILIKCNLCEDIPNIGEPIEREK